MKDIRIVILESGVSSSELMNKINSDKSNERVLECHSHDGQTLNCRTIKKYTTIPNRIKKHYDINTKAYEIKK